MRGAAFHAPVIDRQDGFPPEPIREEMPWLVRNELGAVYNLNSLRERQSRSTPNRYSHSAFNSPIADGSLMNYTQISLLINLPYSTFNTPYVLYVFKSLVLMQPVYSQNTHRHSGGAWTSTRGCRVPGRSRWAWRRPAGRSRRCRSTGWWSPPAAWGPTETWWSAPRDPGPSSTWLAAHDTPHTHTHTQTSVET